MLDFSRLTEHLGEWIGGSAGNAYSVDGLMASAGLDLEALQGLPIDDVLGALATAGIDTSALTEGQIGEILAAIQSDGDGL